MAGAAGVLDSATEMKAGALLAAAAAVAALQPPADNTDDNRRDSSGIRRTQHTGQSRSIEHTASSRRRPEHRA